MGDNAGTVSKVWVDNNDAAGKRPSSVKFTLSIRGDTIGEYEITSQNGWVFQLRDFEVDDGYGIAEESVAGYTTSFRKHY